MKKLSKKQLRRLAAGVGAGAVLAGVGVTAAVTGNSEPAGVKTAYASGKIEYVSDATFKKGANLAFDIDYQLPSKKLTKLKLADPLEKVFTLTKERVFDNDNDVTDQGKLDLDTTTNEATWTAKDPGKWFGHKLTTRLEVTLKANADLTKYLDKNTNQYNIPNTGYMETDDGKVDSNKVVVHTPNDKEPTVLKQVEDKDSVYGDNAKYEVGDTYHYRLQYTVPKNGTDLTHVDFNDDLEDVLDLQDVKIVDDKGNDITKSDGDLKIDDKAESFVWQPTKDYLGKMADHSFIVDVTAKIKPDADLTKYVDKASGNYLIPNTANINYNNKEIPSNKVTVQTPPPADNKVVKSVQGLSGSYHEDNDKVEVGKDFTYKVSFTPAQGKKHDDLVFSDDLEDVLDLEKVEIDNSNGKDVTDSNGVLKKDDDKESWTWTPKVDTDMGGKTYTAVITAKVKPNSNLSKYLKGNTIQIPNKAVMKDGGKDTNSNNVDVIPKTEPSKAIKGIVKNPNDWTKYFGNKSETASGQDKNVMDRAMDTNADNEPAAVKDARKYAKQDKNGNYVKANKNVTDEQFSKAIETLTTPYKSTKAVDTREQNDSSVGTTAPSNVNDLKSIINATTVTENQAQRGDAVDYLLTFEIGNDQEMKSLVLSDDLEDVLDLKNVVILDDAGNNITADGNLKTDDQEESWTWTAKDPTKYSSKTLYAAVASNVKTNADLSKYQDGKIPNKGHMLINGNDDPTNEVDTTLTGKGAAPGTPDSENKDHSNNPLDFHSTNNPITGKNGILPKTGHFILKNVGWIVGLLTAAAAAVGTYLYKNKKKTEK